jgi:hypothetical protein
MIQLGDEYHHVLAVFARTLGMEPEQLQGVIDGSEEAGHAGTKASFVTREEDFDFQERKTMSR